VTKLCLEGTARSPAQELGTGEDASLYGRTHPANHWRRFWSAFERNSETLATCRWVFNFDKPETRPHIE
jgi:hypothetical protein